MWPQETNQLFSLVLTIFECNKKFKISIDDVYRLKIRLCTVDIYVN
jgi:hypothetical protein